MTNDLATLFAYDRWAEARMLDACRLVPPDRYGEEPAPGWSSLRATVAHLAAGADVWTRRFLGQPVDAYVPESELATPDDVARLSGANHDVLERLIASLSPDQLAAPFTYRTFRGQIEHPPALGRPPPPRQPRHLPPGAGRLQAQAPGRRAPRHRLRHLGRRAVQVELTGPP